MSKPREGIYLMRRLTTKNIMEDDINNNMKS